MLLTVNVPRLRGDWEELLQGRWVLAAFIPLSTRSTSSQSFSVQLRYEGWLLGRRKRKRGGARGGAPSLLKATSWLSLSRRPFFFPTFDKSPPQFFFSSLVMQFFWQVRHGVEPTAQPSYISSLGSGSHALLNSFLFKVKWCAPCSTSFLLLLFPRWAIIFFALC